MRGVQVSDKTEGKDGLVRVIARIKKESKVWRRVVDPHLARWRDNLLDSHAFVNVWTEGARVKAAAYFNGHLISLLFFTNALTLGLLVWKW